MNENVKIIAAGLLGAGIGFAVGYKVLEKRLEQAFDERLAEETKDMREVYQNLKQPYSSPEEAVRELIVPEVAKDPRVQNGAKIAYDKVQPKVDIPEQPEVVQNVFSRTGPYLISQDAFMANETDPEHVQATLTYYEQSDQVCGEKDEPIDNSDLVIGTEFKEKFGWESSDANTVHVRNEDLHMDFEVVRSEGSYEQEVLGQAPPDISVPPHKRVGR